MPCNIAGLYSLLIIIHFLFQVVSVWVKYNPVKKMSGKLLRRPLPPAKVDGNTSLLLDQCDPKINQITDQYTELKSKEDLQALQPEILDSNSVISSLPPNPPPSRLFLQSKSFQDVAALVCDVSKSKSNPNILRNPECVTAWSQFPMRAPRKFATQSSLIMKLNKEETKLVQPSNNGINNLIVTVSKLSQVSESYTKQIVYSKHTYHKISKLVAERYLKQSSEPKHLKVVHIPTENLGEFPKRVPQRQLLIELASLIKEHMRETMNIDIHTVIQPLRRFQFGLQNKPETEILLYQQTPLQDIPPRSITQRLVEKYVLNLDFIFSIA